MLLGQQDLTAEIRMRLTEHLLLLVIQLSMVQQLHKFLMSQDQALVKLKLKEIAKVRLLESQDHLGITCRSQISSLHRIKLRSELLNLHSKINLKL